MICRYSFVYHISKCRLYGTLCVNMCCEQICRLIVRGHLFLQCMMLCTTIRAKGQDNESLLSGIGENLFILKPADFLPTSIALNRAHHQNCFASLYFASPPAVDFMCTWK